MTQYLAFTLGPIYHTLSQARKTRELWAASYVFSMLMGKLLSALALKGPGEVLSPIIENPERRHGAGVFPDRCFLKLNKPVDADAIREIIQEAIQQTGKASKISPAYLQRCFRVCAAILEHNETDPGSPVLKLNRLLDALELQTKMPPTDKGNLVSRLENNIHTLYADGNQGAEKETIFIQFDNECQIRLPSLLELATSELKAAHAPHYADFLTGPINKGVLEYQRIMRQEGNELAVKERAKKLEANQEEDAVLRLKKELGKAFKFRHKYVCFVKADGDNMGKTLTAIGDDHQKIESFSKALGKFAQEAVDKIIEYRGIPVYAGGDDLLFVAPLQNEKQEHIFQLLETLDAEFPKALLSGLVPEIKDEDKPALSFGISVSFYKYPMFESLDAMDEQLFGEAKHYPGKNAVAFRVLKHSGQSFDTVLGKNGDAWEKLKDLLGKCRNLDQSFLTSVMHRLTELEPYLEDALKHGQSVHFFKHHFNEDVHRHTEFDQFLTAVRMLAEAAWNESGQNMETAIRQVHAILRFIQFLNQEDHD
jgi:CRISPR-associated protein Cmr2